MVVKRYAVILEGTDVENVIVLDDALEPTWFENDPDRELVQDIGQPNVHPGAAYDDTRPPRDRFTLITRVPTRQDDLNDKLMDDSITEREMIELLRLERGGS